MNEPTPVAQVPEPHVKVPIEVIVAQMVAKKAVYLPNENNKKLSFIYQSYQHDYLYRKASVEKGKKGWLVTEGIHKGDVRTGGEDIKSAQISLPFEWLAAEPVKLDGGTHSTLLSYSVPIESSFTVFLRNPYLVERFLLLMFAPYT